CFHKHCWQIYTTPSQLCMFLPRIVQKHTGFVLCDETISSRECVCYQLMSACVSCSGVCVLFSAQECVCAILRSVCAISSGVCVCYQLRSVCVLSSSQEA